MELEIRGQETRVIQCEDDETIQDVKVLIAIKTKFT